MVVRGSEGRTSQFSRIKQRPPAADLSGPKASAESLTPRSSNLAAATAVLELTPSSAVLAPALSFLPFFPLNRSLTFLPFLVTESKKLSMLVFSKLRGHRREQMVVAIRDGLVARIQFAPIQALGRLLKIREGHEPEQISAREIGYPTPRR